MRRGFLCLLLVLALLAGCSADKPVLECIDADYAMDAAQFQYYFGYQLANAIELYGTDAFDLRADLSQQPYNETQSWQEFLISDAFALAEQTMRLCLAANAAGYTLPSEARGDLAAITAETAAAHGYADAKSYLAAYYGKGAELKGYGAFLEALALAQAYSEELYSGAQYTPAQIEAYYDSRAEDYTMRFDLPKEDIYPLDVRIIRFYPDNAGSAADWAQAEARAKAVQEEFLAAPSDEAFGALADRYTEDFNAPDGGLYRELTPQMSAQVLEDWLYPADTQRAAGDLTLIREADTYALCYISSVAEQPYWMAIAERDLRDSAHITLLQQLERDYPFTQHPDRVVLQIPTAYTEKGRIPADVVPVG